MTQSSPALSTQLPRLAIGIGVSIVCLAIMAWQIDFRGMLRAISGFAWPTLLAGLALLAVGYGFRILRWRLMLRAAGADTSYRGCAAAFMGSIALNNVLPARLGDVVRAFVFPVGLGISKTTAAGSLVMERLLDLTTILAFLGVGLAVSPIIELPAGLRVTAILLAIMAFGILAAMFMFSAALARLCGSIGQRQFGGRFGGLIKRLLAIAESLFASFDKMSRPGVLVSLFLLSAGVWIGETGLYWMLLRGFGLPAGYSAGAVIMGIATLATLVPSSPGYVGPFHLAAYAAMSMLGGPPEQAASFAVLAHAAIWLPTTLVGAIAILAHPELFARKRLSSAPT